MCILFLGSCIKWIYIVRFVSISSLRFADNTYRLVCDDNAAAGAQIVRYSNSSTVLVVGVKSKAKCEKRLSVCTQYIRRLTTDWTDGRKNLPAASHPRQLYSQRDDNEEPEQKERQCGLKRTEACRQPISQSVSRVEKRITSFTIRQPVQCSWCGRAAKVGKLTLNSVSVGQRRAIIYPLPSLQVKQC